MAAIVSSCNFCDGGAYDAAVKKAQNPKMDLRDNPFVKQSAAEVRFGEIVDKNMERLHMDAHRRRNLLHGEVYEGIMSTRYGG